MEEVKDYILVHGIISNIKDNVDKEYIWFDITRNEYYKDKEGNMKNNPSFFSARINKSLKNSITPIYKNALLLPLSKDEQENIRIKKYINEGLTAPIEINQVIGKIQFRVGNDTLGEIDICAPYSISRTNVLEYFSIIFNTYLDFKNYIY